MKIFKVFSDTIPTTSVCVIGSITSNREGSEWRLVERSLRRGGQGASEERGEVTPSPPPYSGIGSGVDRGTPRTLAREFAAGGLGS